MVGEKARGSDQIDLAVEAADADENAENLKHDSTFLEKLANNGMMAPVDMRGIGEEFDDAEQLTAELGAKEIVADLCAGGNEKLAQGRRVCVEDFGSSRAETNRAGLIEEDDGDEDVTVGNSGVVPTLNASERNETGPMTRPMLTPGGIVAGTLESPLASGPCWTETDLKFTNEGMETKRFKVRGWGKVHRVSSVQENPGTRFDDRDDDMRQTDREGFVLKDWRHTREEAREGRQIWMQFEGRTKPWDVLYSESGNEMERRWREKNGMEGVGMHMVSEGRLVDWNGIKDLADGATVQVMVNIHGGMGKRGKKKKQGNPWESDGGSGEMSSAEEQFEIMDKAAFMAEHRKVMGNSYVDMWVDMEMEEVKAQVEELRRLSEGTEDQKTLAALSLMWMVERRKEKRREELREREEAEHREAHKKEEEHQEIRKREEVELKGKREELAVLMDPRSKKAADRARLEREGISILEAETRHEEKKRQLKEEDRASLEREGDLILEAEAQYEGKRREAEEERRAKEIWKEIEDRQRLEREGDEMMEAIKRHERVEEEKKEERVKKVVEELGEFVEGGEKETQRIGGEGIEERMEKEEARNEGISVEEEAFREADEVRKWRTNEEEQEERNDGVANFTVEEYREEFEKITAAEFRELEEEMMVISKRFIHEREEEEERREADELRQVLEVAKRKTREAEENTKIVEEEARKMFAAAKERAMEETRAMERVAAATEQGERMRTTRMAADGERTWTGRPRTTSAATSMAADDERRGTRRTWRR